MHTVIKFILLLVTTVTLVISFTSGAIGYAWYSLTSGIAHPQITEMQIPRWDEMPRLSKELLIPAIAIIGVFWVLLAPTPSIGNDKKPEPKKGRNRRNFQNDD